MGVSGNIEKTRAAYAAFAQGDLGPVTAFFSADALVCAPDAEGRRISWSDRGGFLGQVSDIQANWSHERFDVLRIDGEGEWVTAFVRVVTRHRRNGRLFDAVLVHAFRFLDGLCVEYHELLDADRLAAAAADEGVRQSRDGG